MSKKITLGVCAGIAAYKACEIIRLLKKDGHQVQVMMTEGSKKFITPLTLQTLSGHSVATDMFDLTQESEIGHIHLADWPDIVLIAPATADVLARMAQGLCNDIVTTVLLATKAKVVVAPSMNVNMFEHPATQENIAKLKARGVQVIDPESGELACGWNGTGRLADPQKIVAALF